MLDDGSWHLFPLWEPSGAALYHLDHLRNILRARRSSEEQFDGQIVGKKNAHLPRDNGGATEDEQGLPSFLTANGIHSTGKGARIR